MKRFFLLVLLFLTLSFTIEAQIQKDKSLMVKGKLTHSAKKATLYSAVLPGFGQAYNRKYWKIPIVYAGIGTLSYFIVSNRNLYLEAREAYDYVVNGYDYPIDNELVTKYEAADLLQIRDYYRRNTELSFIIMGLWYILNIIDANVDAHFFDYDISDNLEVRIEPKINHLLIPNISQKSFPQFGIGVSLGF